MTIVSELPDTARLVAGLRDGADAARRGAALAELKDAGPAAMDVGIQLLADDDDDVVLQAVQLVEHLGEARALEPLRALLFRSNPNVVQAALVALGRLGTAQVLGDLTKFLGGDPWLAMAAAAALGDLRDPSAIGPLAAVLEDPVLGPVAADAVGRIGGVEAYRIIAGLWLRRGATTGAEVELLAEVAESLTETAPDFPGLLPALAAALEAMPGCRSAAARALLASGPSPFDAAALEALRAQASDGEPVPEALLRRADLTDRLLRADGALSVWGLRLAAHYPAAATLDGLAGAARGADPLAHADVITEALLAFEAAGLGPVIVEISDALPRRDRASWGPLVRRREAEIREALLAAPAGSQGGRAVLAAAVCQDVRGAAKLIASLPPDERLEAIALAGERKDVLARLPWLEWLEEAPERYGALAVATAEAAGLAGQLPALRALTAMRPSGQLVQLLARLRDRASVPLLVELVECGPAQVVPFALAALGAIGGEEARAALGRLVGSGRPWEEFEWRALAECATPDDYPRFRAAATRPDWRVRLVAAEALARSGDPADRAALRDLAKDPVDVVASRAQSLAAQ